MTIENGERDARRPNGRTKVNFVRAMVRQKPKIRGDDSDGGDGGSDDDGRRAVNR